MMQIKKGAEISLEVIIAAVIALIVLIIVIVIFSKQAGERGNDFNQIGNQASDAVKGKICSPFFSKNYCVTIANECKGTLVGDANAHDDCKKASPPKPYCCEPGSDFGASEPDKNENPQNAAQP